MLNFIFLITLLILSSCGEDFSNETKSDQFLKTRSRNSSVGKEDVINNTRIEDIINVVDDEKIIKLKYPFWTFTNKKFLISDVNHQYFSNNNANKWELVHDKFFYELGAKYFKLDRKSHLKLSVNDFFSTSITAEKRKSSTLNNEVLLDGGMRFFQGRLNYDDFYTRDRLWLSVHQFEGDEKFKILDKKLHEGENYFFTSPGEGENGAGVIINSDKTDHVDFSSDRARFIIEASRFFHEGKSKKDIIKKINDHYNYLFFYRDGMNVYLVPKDYSFRKALLSIDSKIQLDEYNQILSSSNIERNEFLKDFPQAIFERNNLNSKGILFFEDIIDHDDVETKYYYYFEGSYEEILSKNFIYLVTKNSLKGASVNFELSPSEAVTGETERTIYKNIFYEYEKEIIVREKKPRIVCERYDRHFDKYCIENIITHKKMAKYRVFKNRIQVKRDKHPMSLTPASEVNSFKRSTITSLGEQYNVFLRLGHHEGKYVEKVKLQSKNKKEHCRNIRIGYLGLTSPQEDLVPIEKQFHETKKFCDGPKYHHRIKRIKLN